MTKKLFWLEYSNVDTTHISYPFKIVGFDVKHSGWCKNNEQVFLEMIVPIVIDWNPDIVVFWLLGSDDLKPIEEPSEVKIACERIREKLTNIKIKHL